MREAIRCCIACILPCGALDVVRVVHANGRVEEIRAAVTAGDVMRAHPDHVLRRPPNGAEATKAVTLPPDAELERGRIYFLVPVETTAAARRRRKGRRRKTKAADSDGASAAAAAGKAMRDLNERYLSEILSEKVSTGYIERRRGRVAVWRPHLDSISETSMEL
ncbi:uncharacterized protein LOC121983202 [Zingiber officinale]|uniref:uncharacterized protein LOC121983201 n=1 Tax=Zingiber officinale TaxID=94328 RepID=UPI001C4CCA0A|nr:uncharacterized protein LOC121983201 [Zingiber officinale]XP_042392092.1 uncharacterized protein LOC121983202 [Zingiber officinale]